MDDILIRLVCLALAAFSVDACFMAPDPDCGCVFVNDNPIPETDYISDPIRVPDAARFRSRMEDALTQHWAAYTFIKSFPDQHDSPEDSGKPVCKTDHKHILGYWKDYGVTLCLVVRPETQLLRRAACGGEACCNQTTCEPSGFVLTSYLVYCDVFYTRDHGEDQGCLVGTDVLLEYHSPHVPEDDFIGRVRRDAPAEHVDDTDKYRAERSAQNHNDVLEAHRAGRQKRLEPPAPDPCDGGNGYFEFRHDYFPSTCSCRNCKGCI